ncbi:hypothetical protein EBR21_07230, partial [bacterium]|nr:hypothetical protein [bacterium]
VVPAGVVLDKAGNSSVNYSNIVALNVDNTPPVVTLGSLGTTNVNSAIVSITLSGTCSVGDGNVFLDGDVVSQQTSCSSGGTGSTGVFYLSSFQLTDGYGPKNIRIKQIDAAGNVGTSATQTITRLPALPTITMTLPARPAA